MIEKLGFQGINDVLTIFDYMYSKFQCVEPLALQNPWESSLNE